MLRHQPYRPPLPQPPADLIRVDTYDTRRFMNPLPGIWDEPATVPGYCHASPKGEINDGILIDNLKKIKIGF